MLMIHVAKDCYLQIPAKPSWLLTKYFVMIWIFHQWPH
uniref:Uncharacterized protein n=1 Tax=Rhizophora mucronata TaxID=61149 RepID=A0A2P2N163_RHIMU